MKRENMDSPQIRVKLSCAEVEGSPRVDLDFGVKEENVSERASEIEEVFPNLSLRRAPRQTV